MTVLVYLNTAGSLVDRLIPELQWGSRAAMITSPVFRTRANPFRAYGPCLFESVQSSERAMCEFHANLGGSIVVAKLR